MRGEDPAFRKSVSLSLLIHLLVLFGPVLLFRMGCMEPYEVPEGSGVESLEVIRVQKVKKREEERFVLNLNSPISFYVPKPEDSPVFEEVDELTQNVYEAQDIGKLGAGGGKSGGWPDGMEKARVRFIRLEYDGGDWDQNMGYGGDYNMLKAFRELTGFKIADATESIPVARLRHFPRRRAPPFVYLTGGEEGRMRFSRAELNLLREYCLEMGGMIFADNGGGSFDTDFRAALRRIFPDLPLVEIAYDDVIFRYPYVFPRGAPPLWHHSGMNAMGVRHRGRWVVFYHQGDLNDAWKDGHSDISQGLANEAYRLGVNVIYYAFNQYMRINFGGKVPR